MSNAKRKSNSYQKFIIQPLHINHGAIGIPVENLDISQNFTPQYNPQEVYGRMDPIVTYKNTKRSLTINFSCQAHHYFDGPLGVINNIRSINKITQFLYPSYQDITTGYPGNNLALLKAPPFFRIMYGNYIGSYDSVGMYPAADKFGEGGLTGYITAFNHSLGKIARNVAFGYNELDVDGKPLGYRALPREIKVNMSFQVIHDKQVGWTKDEFSPNGYGENFPYNAGNSVEDAFLQKLNDKEGVFQMGDKLIDNLDDNTFAEDENGKRRGAEGEMIHAETATNVIMTKADVTNNEAKNKITSARKQKAMAAKLNKLKGEVRTEWRDEYYKKGKEENWHGGYIDSTSNWWTEPK